MVYFWEWISLAETFLEKRDSWLGNFEDELRVNCILHRLPHEYSLWHMLWVEIFPFLVGSSAESIQVGRYLWCLLVSSNRDFFRSLVIEIQHPANFIFFNDTRSFSFPFAILIWVELIVVSCFDPVWDGFPLSRTHYCECHLRFQAWLVKGGEYSKAVVYFELGVKILLVVFAISVWVHPALVLIVRSHITHLYTVPADYDLVGLKLNLLSLKSFIA